MRNLFICNTYMQFLVCLQIVKELKASDINEIILTDHSARMRDVAFRLREEHIFERIYYVTSRESIEAKGRIQYYSYLISVACGKGKFERLLKKAGIDDYRYDVVFAYNRNLLMYGIYFMVCQKYCPPNLYGIEEGFLSYKNLIDPPISRNLKILIGIKNIVSNNRQNAKMEMFYVFLEELLEQHNVKTMKVPLFNKGNKQLLDCLKRLFDYSPQCLPPIIYFSGNADIDGFCVDEHLLVRRLADMVGKDNIVVKKHPRDTRTVYQNMGICVYENSYIPWEVVALLEDFSGKIFVTLYSTSILTAAVITGDEVYGYYLFPLIKGKNKRLEEEIIMPLDIEEKLKFFQKKGLCVNCKIIHNFEEMENEFKSMS